MFLAIVNHKGITDGLPCVLSVFSCWADQRRLGVQSLGDVMHAEMAKGYCMSLIQSPW